MTDHERADGLEAYRDDPGYTAPEMQPGHGEIDQPDGNPDFGVVAGTGMTIGVGGGALAGEALIEEVEEERPDMSVKPDGED